MAPKKKAQKVSLGDFLGDSGSSWADEMDAMPTAPGQFSDDVLPPFKRGPAGADRDGFGARGDSFRGGSGMDRPPRADVPFPEKPPYTAFVGNLAFETSQDEVRDLFTSAGLECSSIRMVSGHDGRPKGFCYVEFPEAGMLRQALTFSGADLGGRSIRVSVAEPPRSDSMGRSDGEWTRSGPLPDIPGRGGFSSRGPRDGPPMDSGRDWGEARGAKFTPGAPTSPSLGSARSGGFGDRNREPGSARMGGFRDGPAPIADDKDWGAVRGGKFTPSPVPERRGPPERKFSGAEETRDWRARSAANSPPASDAGAPARPVERKKLQLAARSAAPAASEASPATASRSSIFGAATPVDTASKEREVEEKLEKEAAPAPAVVSPPATRSASNPFGAAKPVDVSAREKAVEEKLAKDREELERKMKEAKLSEEKSAAPKKEWRRPSGPASGAPAVTSPSDEQKATPSPAAPQQQPKMIPKNQGVRKEGFSYSNIAGGNPKSPTTEEPKAKSNGE